ncbi:hypothetical protein [Alienimonas californiensis]|uniref:Uncharacterized protein n=1 Tax=Alienimonas californiensis TaxID=2527989 RepID=A0A517P862_9PLAN|nr:hypothetical protein [Alienimonas californiensis]QDT15569.1 hypothetical protein CA12_16540 [Alienimonas californiensis]
MSAPATPPSATDEERFVLDMAARLEAVGVPYMLTGSVASSSYGQRRQTADADILIDPDTPGRVVRFVRALGEAFYADANTARAAVHDRRMFNVIDYASAFKADLIVCKAEAYDRQAFARRVRRPLNAALPEVWMVSAEDSILSKLRWAKETGSTRQHDDVVGVLAVQGAALDDAYLDRWAEELGLRADLDRVRAVAAPLMPDDGPGEC